MYFVYLLSGGRDKNNYKLDIIHDDNDVYNSKLLYTWSKFI